MSLQVIGAGLGRTGTYSLKKAIERLGFGPCHHMEEVIHHMATQMPLWTTAVKGSPDWPAIYNGYASADDWPTAAFYRELNAFYPNAKFILTVRSSESWVASFSDTIYKLMAGRAHAPAKMQPWFDMATGMMIKSGFPDGMNAAELAKAFNAHAEAVKAAIPADRLLTYEVKEGWGPLCAFLRVPIPDEAFPRTNDRADFWDRVTSAASEPSPDNA